MKKVVIDIDGTICEERPTFERSLAKVLPKAKEVINGWRANGVFVILFTSRTWAEYDMTKDWLDRNGIGFDVLICGKPVVDLWIDDRALRFTSWDDISRYVNE